MKFEEGQRANRALNKITKTYRAVQARKLGVIGLHPGQDVLVWVLAQEPAGMTVSQLAIRLGVEPPTATRSLTRMEPTGLFTREPVEGDRRQVRIVLTTRARELVPEIERVWAELAREAFGHLDRSQRDDVVAALESAVDAWLPGLDEAVLAGES
ncbi:MAG: MarR family winged helix-turn-helix transcriptional regulator [Nocardioidaceae bacterium]